MDWNQKYQGQDYFYGTKPNDFLKSQATLWQSPKKILCIAEGEGRNATYLASLGHRVFAIDSSSVAREKALKLAASSQVTIDYQLADLANFDFGQQQWDAVVSIFCHLPSSLRHKVHQRVEAGLVQGGTFLLEAYTPNQLAFGTGGPKDTNLLYTPDQITNDFSQINWSLAHEVQRNIQEGTGHQGMSAVIQFLGSKK
ncbi:bifunctional 2-polyprenyl-6-hydroxyphenol methylase/3-demethylubiquinol 3-O-methyltransferase UbiG [Thiomicrospira sp. ALE5]|uniref:class I SAM-dependent methyltransferase n=1 Tax=Thiomicrospira sp. ALE5 TaxID=748650 RepID=UPI0008E43922|nr:class I SAM-dependent methyltransferase [Thiomicrospira sp. ALE5]SFR48742.1 Methyltransferase domain-containing protein [Thiomicrospira sp. ALE5]